MQLKDGSKWRWLAVVVMIWSGYVMQQFATWVMVIPPDQLGMHHAGVIAAVYAPIAAVFKFAFDFALDGRVGQNNA